VQEAFSIGATGYVAKEMLEVSYWWPSMLLFAARSL